MPGPENTFIDSVHRCLPSEDSLHREGMWNMYRGGTADMWYSGKHDLWVEYKFIVVPKRGSTLISLLAEKKPSMSALQKEWLGRRYKEGRNVAVIVGSKDGGVVLTNLAWEGTYTADEFRSMLYTRAELAEWIVNKTGTFKHELRAIVHNSKSSGGRVQNGERRSSSRVHVQEIIRTQAVQHIAKGKPHKGTSS